MLSRTDSIWRELEGGYRLPYDASKALIQMEAGESVWDELWNEPYHQGDVGVASYAAIPQLVRISEARESPIGIFTHLAATLNSTASQDYIDARLQNLAATVTPRRHSHQA